MYIVSPRLEIISEDFIFASKRFTTNRTVYRNEVHTLLCNDMLHLFVHLENSEMSQNSEHSHHHGRDLRYQ